MTDLVNSLPQNVVFDILCSWLNLSDVARVDSAVCAHSSRGIFKYLLTLGVWHCDRKRCWDDPLFVRWIVNAKLHLKRVHIGEGLRSPQLRVDFFKESGSSFLDVTMSGDNKYVENSLIDLSLTCSNIESCSVDAGCDSTLLTLLARNTKLRRISVTDDSHDISGDLLYRAVQFAPELSYITLYTCEYVSQRSLELFVKHCPESLKRLVLLCSEPVQYATRFASELLEAILKKCKDLLELQLGTLQKFPLEATIGVIEPSIVSHNMLFLRFQWDKPRDGDISAVLAQLSRIMPNLQTLIALGARENTNICLSPSAFENILMRFVHLRQLVTIASFEKLAGAHPLPSLSDTQRESLLLPGTSALQTVFVAGGLSDSQALFARCPLLTRIGYSTANVYFEEYAGLQVHIAACVHMNLHTLGIEGKVPAQILTEVHGLQEFILLQCALDMDTDTLITIARNNPELRSLHLEEMSREVSYKALLTVLNSCPLLRSVTFHFRDGSVDSRQRYHEQDNCNGRAMLRALVMKQYPRLERFECNIVP